MNKLNRKERVKRLDVCVALFYSKQWILCPIPIPSPHGCKSDRSKALEQKITAKVPLWNLLLKAINLTTKRGRKLLTISN